QVTIEHGDVVVISARTIPGNERAVAHVIDNLYRRGAEVVTHETPDVHVSGHACEEELKLMINMTRPKFFIPMHGTLRHLIHHARTRARRRQSGHPRRSARAADWHLSRKSRRRVARFRSPARKNARDVETLLQERDGAAPSHTSGGLGDVKVNVECSMFNVEC